MSGYLFIGTDEHGVPRATTTWHTGGRKPSTPAERGRDPREFIWYSCYRGGLSLYVEWGPRTQWHYHVKDDRMKPKAGFATPVDAMRAALAAATTFSERRHRELLDATAELDRLTKKGERTLAKPPGDGHGNDYGADE